MFQYFLYKKHSKLLISNTELPSVSHNRISRQKIVDPKRGANTAVSAAEIESFIVFPVKASVTAADNDAKPR